MISTGSLVGRYRVLRPLAEGGMGRGYLAKTEGPGGFSKQVVLKTLHPHLAQDLSFLDVFLVEARVSASLNHPNVAQVFELVEADDSYFLAMEYVQGRSLRDLLAHGPVEPPLGVWIVSQVLRALQHAHEKVDAGGMPAPVLHRDVTPENVLLSCDGAVKLVDFGLAGVRAHRAGKSGYVAPELLEGGHASFASDVYGAGKLLQEAVGDGAPALAELVARATAPAPEARFPSARAFADALDRWSKESGAFVTSEQLAARLREAFGPPTDAEAETPAPGRKTAVLTSTASPPAPAPPPMQPRATSLRRAAWAALVLALAIAGFGALRLEGTASASEPAPPIASSPAPAPTPPPAVVAPPALVASATAPEPEPAPRAAPANGQLEVRVNPWARVIIDSRDVGTTPLKPLALAPGLHAIKLVNDELGVTTTRQVRVRPGDTSVLRVDLLDVLSEQ